MTTYRRRTGFPLPQGPSGHPMRTRIPFPLLHSCASRLTQGHSAALPGRSSIQRPRPRRRIMAVAGLIMVVTVEEGRRCTSRIVLIQGFRKRRQDTMPNMVASLARLRGEHHRRPLRCSLMLSGEHLQRMAAAENSTAMVVEETASRWPAMPARSMRSGLLRQRRPPLPERRLGEVVCGCRASSPKASRSDSQLHGSQRNLLLAMPYTACALSIMGVPSSYTTYRDSASLHACATQPCMIMFLKCFLEVLTLKLLRWRHDRHPKEPSVTG